MWIIQTEVPYEGMFESSEMTTEEVLSYLKAGWSYDDSIHIRPATKSYDVCAFIKEFKR